MRTSCLIVMISWFFCAAAAPNSAQNSKLAVQNLEPLSHSILGHIAAFGQSLQYGLDLQKHYFFLHRQNFRGNADALFKNLVDKVRDLPDEQRPWLLVLDFSYPDSYLASENILPPEMASLFDSQAEYGALSAADKEKFIFRPFFENLKKQKKASVIHIDHHYPYPLLAKTSTTVLAGDFLIWLHDLADAQGADSASAQELLKIISSSFSFMDHSDADILLAHFLMRNAANGSFLRRHAELLKRTALFNDHQTISGSERERNEVLILFDIVSAVEEDLKKGTCNPADAFQRIHDSVALIDELKALLPGSEVSLEKELYKALQNESFRQKLSAASLGVSEIFSMEYQNLNAKAQAIALMENEALEAKAQGRFQIEIDELSRGTLRLSHGVLVAHVLDGISIHEASVIKYYLETKQSPLLQGARLLVACVTDPVSGARYIKIRTLDPQISLTPDFIADLRAAGLDAGGRAGAGSGAYGKTGALGLSFQDLHRDISTIVRAFQRRFEDPSSCESDAKPSKDPQT